MVFFEFFSLKFRIGADLWAEPPNRFLRTSTYSFASRWSLKPFPLPRHSRPRGGRRPRPLETRPETLVAKPVVFVEAGLYEDKTGLSGRL